MLTMMPSRLGFGCPNCREWSAVSSYVSIVAAETHGIEKVVITHDTAEYSLVIPEENESLCLVSNALDVLGSSAITGADDELQLQ